MNIIDHRILIPASPDKVWQHIADVQANPNWQVNCKSVSILTTMRTGQGMRWRATQKNGRERVFEVTAWYDRMGYEYRMIEGEAFKSNKGLIRLQELPEGTVVQWTFSYEPTGFLGGLQDSLSTKRRLESEMVDSLRNLYRYVGKSAKSDGVQAKSLMRDAPDVESRAHYRPRHPSAQGEGQTQKSSAAAPTLASVPQVSFEPPIVEDDTRPNPGGTTKQAVTGVREPDFLAEIPKTETQTRAVVVDHSDAQVQPFAPADTDTRFKPPAPVTEPTQVAQPAVQSIQPIESTEAEYELPRMKDTAELDTSRISVFEIFGLPKPSETQEMRAVASAVSPPEMAQAQTEPMASVVQGSPSIPGSPLEPPFSRVGLRHRQRAQSVRLRLPK